MRVVTAQHQAQQDLTRPSRLLIQARLPFSRWREKGPGDEGGDRAVAAYTTRPGHSPRLRVNLHREVCEATTHTSASPLLPLAGARGRGMRVVTAQWLHSPLARDTVPGYAVWLCGDTTGRPCTQSPQSSTPNPYGLSFNIYLRSIC